jgi:hypothetical protein
VAAPTRPGPGSAGCYAGSVGGRRDSPGMSRRTPLRSDLASLVLLAVMLTGAWALSADRFGARDVVSSLTAWVIEKVTPEFPSTDPSPRPPEPSLAAANP